MPNILDVDLVIPFNACKLPIAPAGIETGDLLIPLPPGAIDAGSLLAALPVGGIETGDQLAALPPLAIDAGTLRPPEPQGAIDAGTLRIALPTNQIDAGALLVPLASNVIVAGDLLISKPQPGPPYPLNHARIGYNNIIADNIEQLTTAEDLNGAVRATTPATWERWRPGADATLEIELTNPGQADYIGIAAHSLGSAGASVTVELQEDLGDPFILLTNVNPISDNAIFITMPEQQVKTVRLVITGTTAGFEIGVIYCGVALQMIRPLYGGHSPITLSAQNAYLPNRSDRGQFLGRDIIRQGYSTTASFKNLPAQWYRDQFQPFVEHAQILPYFWAWNLLEFPEEVAYCWNDSDISPTNSGTRDLMGVSWNMEGHK
jgi:hypothetical protein